MATINHQVVPTGRENDGAWLYKWPALANGDVGSPLIFPSHSDRSVHVKGTFGAGGTCLIEGTLEITPATWSTLNDPQGNLLSFTTEKIEAVLENVTCIRPRVSAGDGTTALDVYILVSKQMG